jgi:hypothetical protein
MKGKKRSGSSDEGSSSEEFEVMGEIGAIAAHMALNGVKHKPNLMSIVSGIKAAVSPTESEQSTGDQGRPMLVKIFKPEPSKGALSLGVANDGFELRLSAGSGGRRSDGGDDGAGGPSSYYNSGAGAGGTMRRQDDNNDTNIAAMLVELRTPREGDVVMTKRGKSNVASPSKASRRKKARRVNSGRGVAVATDGTQLIKPCTCKKSRCLKLYCDCFAASILCSGDCKCNECKNNEGSSVDRKVAIQQLLKRNPNAFKSRKQVAQEAGCNCKKSGCIKKYCECFNAGLPCGEKCKCLGCQNCKENVNSPNSESEMNAREITSHKLIGKMDIDDVTKPAPRNLTTQNDQTLVRLLPTPTAMDDVTADQQAMQAVQAVAHAAVQALESSKRQTASVYSNKRPTSSPSRPVRAKRVKTGQKD